ncbi:hypothetical protein SNE40_015383 [Patella caerulea]
MPGGIQEVRVTENIRNAAHFATDTINAENKQKQRGSKWHTLISINNPRQQVVNGFLYRMEITLKESECRNQESHNGATITECPPRDNGATKKCNVKVWHQHQRIPEYTLEREECFDI